MTTKNFGYLLIILGILSSLVMFILSDWDESLSLMGNLKHASLICSEAREGHTESRGFYYISCITTSVTLGQGLILSLSVIAIGLIFSINLLPNNLTSKLLPFLENENHTHHRNNK